MRAVELRARDGHALVAGVPLAPEPEGRLWGLPPDLVDDLRQWGQIASSEAVSSGTVTPGSADGVAVSRRGRQLAARLSVVLHAPVDYVDPVTGYRVALRAVGPPVEPVVGGVPAASPGASPAQDPPAAEPTPWGTGLTVALIVGGLVLLANLALAAPLVTGLGWFGVLVDVAVIAGMTPALWLNRHAPTWRWASVGAIAGMVLTVPALVVAAAG